MYVQMYTYGYVFKYVYLYYKYSVNYYYCFVREVTEFMDGCGLDRGKNLQVYLKVLTNLIGVE